MDYFDPFSPDLTPEEKNEAHSRLLVAVTVVMMLLSRSDTSLIVGSILLAIVYISSQEGSPSPQSPVRRHRRENGKYRQPITRMSSYSHSLPPETAEEHLAEIEREYAQLNFGGNSQKQARLQSQVQYGSAISQARYQQDLSRRLAFDQRKLHPSVPCAEPNEYMPKNPMPYDPIFRVNGREPPAVSQYYDPVADMFQPMELVDPAYVTEPVQDPTGMALPPMVDHAEELLESERLRSDMNAPFLHL